LIETSGLTRRFGDLVALHPLSLRVEAGEICAFLGPNGAGKSTTVKMLTGLLPPSAGCARVGGADAATESNTVKRLAGVLPENLGLFDSLTVEEHLTLCGRVHGLTAAETGARAADLLHLLGLAKARNMFAEDCSHGMRKKTALAMALMHNPGVLFLDEPFEGIDPVTAHSIRELLIWLASRGVTVFLTSHILAIVERLATQVVLIRAGEVVWDSPVDALPRSLEEHYFELVESPVEARPSWLGPGPR
jgi:ABC-2 type transport system ATP-binding protein